ncbi:MAG: DUF3501 family protein [Candidatus Manganitrophaceae bacterium]|nr:MAG: DUF3501 family protein [Candidatus Manganitrophaceae bacterium]
MKKIEIEELHPLAEYEKIRDSFRRQIMEEKKKRRIQVGPYVSLTFENRETILFQIQEMLRVERVEDPVKVQEEIDVYNDLIPDEGELSATLFIEITDEGKVKEILDRLIGIDRPNVVYFQIGKKKVAADFEAGRSTEEKISAVHYVRFKWNPTSVETFRSEKENYLVVEHPQYKERALISEATKKALLEDLDHAE